MKTLSAEDLDGIFTFENLIGELRTAFAEGAEAPLRHQHTISHPGGTDASLLLMPAWSTDAASGHIGVKIVTVSPDNGAVSMPAVMASYMLMNGRTGVPEALIDGGRLTLWRTSCASALAAQFLAPPQPDTLLMVGAGELAPFLARAHAQVRNYRRILVWNRSKPGAERLADELRAEGHNAAVAPDLDDAVASADVISAATLSRVPLVRGDCVTPGTHIDLVGAFRPQMRETDDACVAKASLFVDTYEGAIKEGGDIAQPLRDGIITKSAIRADLADLCRGNHPGRSSEEEITLFKSTGAALEDLAAAILAYRLAD
ncbi:ornithine cyclodeaminase family protein [Oricola cellulosilytica]|uniref:Ornithine cyclodeaminase family protein n=1 Tax=Oricola cellulosilytica TaxID=1429082 RepID=A0A4R0PLI7_9HYPH|nr:ornithine cyclodeaminase family protein [Oricola cellulosilytica]TCD16309.1 ornithine cyclodeaminase family protein [Oricola cellulosilytica]